MLSNSIKIFTIASLISISSYAYADAASLIGILFKIYEAASAKANDPKVSQEAPQTLQPGNFVRGSGDNAATNGSNLSQVEQNSASSTNDSPATQSASPYAKYHQDQIDDNQLYLEEFNARKLSNNQFKKLYYGQCFGCAFVRNGVTLKNVTEKEKIALEKSLQLKTEQATRAEKNSIAFKAHVYEVIQMMGLSFAQLQELKNNPETENVASHAMILKSVHKGGILFYEHEHQELGTHCLWGVGGKNEFIADCDKLLVLQMKEYKATHKNVSTKLSSQEIKQIAYEINPHEIWKN